MESGFCPSRAGFAGPGSLLLLSPAAFGVLDCSWPVATPTERAPTVVARAAEPTPMNPRRDKCSLSSSVSIFYLLGVKQNSTWISVSTRQMSALIHWRPFRLNLVFLGHVIFQFERLRMVCRDGRAWQRARHSHFARPTDHSPIPACNVLPNAP